MKVRQDTGIHKQTVSKPVGDTGLADEVPRLFHSKKLATSRRRFPLILKKRKLSRRRGGHLPKRGQIEKQNRIWPDKGQKRKNANANSLTASAKKRMKREKRGGHGMAEKKRESWEKGL